jgi:phage tail tube protein FII
VIYAKVFCRYYSLEIDGEQLIEVDIDNMTRIIGGVDKMVEIRDAIGI